jgi:toxin ParE1/3/4
MKIKFLPNAKDRLDSIFQYYVDKGLRKIGRKIRAKIIAKTLILQEFPHAGPEDEYLKLFSSGHRYLVEGDFKIIYKIVNDEVLIIEIFDTRQDPEKIKE